MDLNRSGVLVRPREPFLKWAERHGDGVAYPVGEERTVYLLPSYAMQADVEEMLRHYYDIIFECELEDWMNDQSTWPSGRTYDLFCEWFDVEVNSVVIDLVAGEPLLEDGNGDDASGADEEP